MRFRARRLAPRRGLRVVSGARSTLSASRRPATRRISRGPAWNAVVIAIASGGPSH